MVAGVGVGAAHVGNKFDHEMRLIDHGADGLGPGACTRAEHGHGRAFGGSFASEFAVGGTGPGMVGRGEGRVFRMNAKRAGSREHWVMAHAAQNLVRLGLVVINAGPIAPAVGREVEGHGEVFFAVRRGAC